jgi:hypothetical protein
VKRLLENKKKVRGTKRKSQIMIKNIEEWTKRFPDEDFEYGYWHKHVNQNHTFIGSTKTPSSMRRLLIQTLINRVEYLIRIKPKMNFLVRVIAVITLPNLMDSQIIVFFGEKHFKDFFNRNDKFQIWKHLPNKRSIAMEWKLKIPENMKIKGYEEQVLVGNTKTNSEIWFIGELD